MPQVTIIPYKKSKPKIDPSVFIASGCAIIGDVEIESYSSIWFNSVLRGDVNYIRVGSYTNIQDGSIIHVASQSFPTIIGNHVTIGHQAVVHACTVEDHTLIGMGAKILDGAKIGSESLVAAGSLVPPGAVYPAKSLIMGSPAKVKRTLSSEELEKIHKSALHYAELAKDYFEFC
ncbi:MAG: gamma carbonic anhydrase family protein [Oligoflexales bacterium]